MDFALARIEAQRKRLKLLISRPGSVEDFDDVQRRELLKLLQQKDHMAFLSNLIIGTDEDEEARYETLLKASNVPWLPTEMPHFMSKFHFEFLENYVKGINGYQTSWLDAYLGSNVHFEGRSHWVILHSNEFILLCQVMVASVWYNITLIIFIIIAGMLAGFGMYPKYDYLSSLVVAEFVVQVVFSIDCFVKILHEGRRPYLYWCGPSMGWNNFDFCLTIVCWISDLSIGASNIGFLRLIRVMRLVRLVKIVARIRQLKVIVTGLVRGLSSVKYILLLLFLCFYCYAVAGVLFFRKNDPFHFGGIGIAMVYLFRCSTLDSWSTLFYINAFGCDSEYESISSVIPRRFDIHHIDFIMTNSGKFPLLMCWEPLRSPLVATIYFSTFILLAGFVILSLFIGAVNNGMTEAISEFNARYTDRDARIQEAKEQAQLDPNAAMLQQLRDCFDTVDDDSNNELNSEEFVAALQKLGENQSEIQAATDVVRRKTLARGGSIKFKEFVAVAAEGQLDSYLEEMSWGKGETSKKGPSRTGSMLLSPLTDTDNIIIKVMRSAWGCDDDERSEQAQWAAEHPRLAAYVHISENCKEIQSNFVFQCFTAGAIILASILVGIQTEIGNDSRETVHTLRILEIAVLAIFTLEIAVKLVSEGVQPFNYFIDPWNRFDFFVVFACFIFKIPGVPFVSHIIQLLRLLRLLRILRLIRVLPQLRIILVALSSGAASISFVVVILFIFFFIYANVGILLFSRNDPMHFSNLPIALFTLFRVSTLDNWSDIMVINLYGCDVWIYEFGRAFSDRISHNKENVNCDSPERWGWVSAAFFISFVVVGSNVLLTLFIGIVATTMESAKLDAADDSAGLLRLDRQLTFLGIDNGHQITCYRKIFEILDADFESKVTSEEVKRLVPLFTLVHKHSSFSGTRGVLRRVDVDKMFQVMSLTDEKRYEGFVEFPEFVVLLDFMRRCIIYPHVLEELRIIYDEVKHGEGAERRVSRVAASSAQAPIAVAGDGASLLASSVVSSPALTLGDPAKLDSYGAAWERAREASERMAAALGALRPTAEGAWPASGAVSLQVEVACLESASRQLAELTGEVRPRPKPTRGLFEASRSSTVSSASSSELGRSHATSLSATAALRTAGSKTSAGKASNVENF